MIYKFGSVALANMVICAGTVLTGPAIVTWTAKPSYTLVLPQSIMSAGIGRPINHRIAQL